LASARNGRSRTGEENELAVADGDRAELQLGRSSVRHAPSRPQWAGRLADARNTVTGTMWQGSVGNCVRSIMSAHERQDPHIRYSLRPHEGTLRALALWTKRCAALKMWVTRCCHLRPRRCGANSIFQTVSSSKTKGLFPSPRHRLDIDDVFAGALLQGLLVDRGALWRRKSGAGSGKLRSFRVTDGLQGPLRLRFP